MNSVERPRPYRLREGPRPLRRGRRAAADGGQRPDQRLRPRAADAHPGQGPHPHRDEHVLVRAARAGRRAPRRRRRRPADPRRRPRPRDAGPAAGHGAGRVRGPRLPHRLRSHRLPAHRGGLRRRAARRARRVVASCRRRSSPRRPRPTSATTTRTSASRRSPRRSAPDWPTSFAPPPCGSTAPPPTTPPAAGSSWPTRSSSSATADGTLVLGDEVLTPDSSRFWPADRYQEGRVQPSFDKQYVRDWLTSADSGWDRAADSPPPPLPDEVARVTRERYVAGLRADLRAAIRRLARLSRRVRSGDGCTIRVADRAGGGVGGPARRGVIEGER